MQQVKAKLEIRERRIFTEELKKKVVKDLVSKRTTFKSIMVQHQVSANRVYRWLYKYTPAELFAIAKLITCVQKIILQYCEGL
jgi:transposase-like protein